MSVATLLPTGTPTREADIALKHARVCEFLEDFELDGLLLHTSENFSWYTSGGRNSAGPRGATYASLWIRPGGAIVVIDPHMAEPIAKEQLRALSLEVQTIPWNQSREEFFRKLTGGLNVGCDVPSADFCYEGERLVRWRMDLTPRDRERYREIGRALTYSVEATARRLERVDSEAEVAGQILHRLAKYELAPLEVFVTGESRMQKFGRAHYRDKLIGQQCWLGATAEGGGLCVSVGRTMCFGRPSEQLRRHFQHASMVAAAAVYHPRPGHGPSYTLQKLQRCYQRMDQAEEFQRHPPGFVTGYRPCELRLHEETTYRFGDPVALVWQPGFGIARTLDTVIVDSHGFEVITSMRRWPTIQIEVAGHRIDRPDILVR